MSSFQLSVTPSRRAAARHVTNVRRALLKALAEEEIKRGLTQSEIARVIGVHRSVINRELRGQKDITLGRVGELAFALGRDPEFALLPAGTAVTGDGARTNEYPVTAYAVPTAASPISPTAVAGGNMSYLWVRSIQPIPVAR